MHELSGDKAGGGWFAEDYAWSAALDLSLVFSEGGPRSTVREEGEMNTEDIIDMALAGEKNLRDRISYAIALEREACAKVLDEMAAKDKLSNYYQVAALAIRERGAP